MHIYVNKYTCGYSRTYRKEIKKGYILGDEKGLNEGNGHEYDGVHKMNCFFFNF